MKHERKLSPDEAWDALQKMALRDEGERIGALSEEEIDAELTQHRIEAKALRARGAAFAARLGAMAPIPAVELPVQAPKPAAPKRWVVLLSAATLAAVASAVAVTIVAMTLAKHHDNEPDHWEASIATNAKQAMELRRDAVRACEEQRWLQCRQRLDAAKALDPRGDEGQDVQDWRRAIDDALAPPNRPALPTGPDMK